MGLAGLSETTRPRPLTRTNTTLFLRYLLDWSVCLSPCGVFNTHSECARAIHISSRFNPVEKLEEGVKCRAETTHPQPNQTA